jgi:DNA-binding GntR family transcriptional regulator
MIQYQGLTQAIVDEITTMIISGEIPGSARLNEEEVSSRLKISRPPLREALQILEQQRLVYSIPRRGKYVFELTKDNLRRVLQCREMTECYAIDALEEKGVQFFPELNKAIERAKEAAFPSDNATERIKYLNILNEFHSVLVESSNNDLLTHFYSIISSNIKRYIYIYMFNNTIKPIVYFADHEKIYNYIESKNYHKARQALKSHIRESYERMNHLVVD